MEYIKDMKEQLKKARILGQKSKLEFDKKEYDSAFKKMHKAFMVLRKTKGDNNTETKVAKNNCGKMLVMLKKYDEAIVYLTIPFAILSEKEEIFILLDYEKKFMTSPHIIISTKSVSVKKLLKIAQSKNIPIFKNHSLAKGLMKDCEQFEEILPKYYERVAKILAKTLANIERRKNASA